MLGFYIYSSDKNNLITDCLTVECKVLALIKF